MNKNKILLLTLVHPDLLPPVYAVAQVLRDLQFDIHILTFDSIVHEKLDLGENIELETMGKHYQAGTMERLKLRSNYTKRAKQLLSDETTAIIAFCPFSFQCGSDIRKNIPLIYIALEIADFMLSSFFRSPLSNYRNLKALQNINNADLVATPSLERSAWLAGRCHLDFMPYTILNTGYLPPQERESTYGLFKEMVPADFLDKKVILYTGGVNEFMCVMELVRAFDMVNDDNSVLIIAGLRDNEYCNDIKKFVQDCKTEKRIKLFPYLSRNQIFILQSNSNIGVSLAKESKINVRSSMTAPNKVGEYMLNGLYVLGASTEYLKPFQARGFASLAHSSTPRDISKAIREALASVDEKNYKERIKDFVKDQFCMQQQLKPVINYINQIANSSF